MCLVVVTTAHPKYPLILLNNRDEFLCRPTAIARWWPYPDNHILGGQDLYREEHGTWLGVTKQGRLAVLTNFREEDASLIAGTRSRGAIVNRCLRMSTVNALSSDERVQDSTNEKFDGYGGFTLMFADLKRPGWNDSSLEHHKWQGISLISNRHESIHDITWLCRRPGETHALSNSHYADKSWPKVVVSESLVKAAIQLSIESCDNQEELLDRLLSVLSQDTLAKYQTSKSRVGDWHNFRNSIFIPPINPDQEDVLKLDRPSLPGPAPEKSARSSEPMHGIYGTQKQTVILIDWDGVLHYFERTLFDCHGRSLKPGTSDSQFTFTIEGWNEA